MYFWDIKASYGSCLMLLHLKCNYLCPSPSFFLFFKILVESLKKNIKRLVETERYVKR